MHFDSPRTSDTIAPALPAIIDGLRERGFRLVTITELIDGVLNEPPAEMGRQAPPVSGSTLPVEATKEGCD
jgi:hypothetical protein